MTLRQYLLKQKLEEENRPVLRIVGIQQLRDSMNLQKVILLQQPMTAITKKKKQKPPKKHKEAGK